MTSNERPEICVTPEEGSGWRMKMAKNILKRYRDITFDAVSGLKKMERDGHIIYTLLGPPLKSPINRKRMRYMYKDMTSEDTLIENNEVVKWGSRTPHILSIATNYECQCRCKHCCSDNFRHMDQGQYLEKSQIDSLLQQASKLGTTTVILGGGEALLRKDIGDIIAEIRPPPGRICRRGLR